MRTRKLFAAAMAAALTITSTPCTFSASPQLIQTVYAADVKDTTQEGLTVAGDTTTTGTTVITELSQISDTAEADTAAYVITENSKLTSFDRSCTIKGLPNDITIKPGNEDIVVVLDNLTTDKTITVSAGEYGTVTFFVKGDLKFETGSKGLMWEYVKEDWTFGPSLYIPMIVYGEKGSSITLTGGQTLCGQILAPETTLTVSGEGAYEVGCYPDVIYIDPETGEEQHGNIAAPIVKKYQLIGNVLLKKTAGDELFIAYCEGEKPEPEPEYMEQNGLLFSIEGDHAVCHGKAPDNRRTEIEIPENFISEDYRTAEVDGQTVFTAPLKLIPVTEIADDAFRSDSHITSVTIPDTVTRIGKLAFFGCFELENITVPESVTDIGAGAFFHTLWQEKKQKESPYIVINGILVDGTAATGDLIIPDGVKKINDYAFERCFLITGVVIPEGVETIGEGAFSKCNSIGNVVLPSTLKSVGKDAFKRDSDYNGLYIEYATYNGTKEQWKQVEIAEGNTALTVPVETPDLINHPDSFEYSYITAGDFTFKYDMEVQELSLVDVRDTAMYKVQVPSSVSLSDFSYFKSYWNLDVDSLPVTRIITGAPYSKVESGEAAPSAFQNCRWVTSISIPNTVRKISENAFKGCDNLLEIIYQGTKSEWEAASADVTIPAGVEVNYMLETPQEETEYIVEDGVLTKVNYPHGDIVIPDGVKKIKSGVFAGVSLIRSVTIPEGVTDIDMCAFQDCEALKKVTLPSTLKSIGKCAFYGCTSLEAVEMPASVEYVGAGAFDNTYWLNSFLCERSNVEGNLELVSGNVLILGKDIEKVTVPEGVTVIAGSAFEDNLTTREITVPEGVVSIGGRAFADIYTLRNVYLPKSLKRIGEEAFDRNSRNGKDKSIEDLGITYAGLKEDWAKIDIDDNNDGLKYVINAGNITYGDYRPTEFIGTEYHGFAMLPEGITEIPDNAFAGNTKITTVVIPEGVTYIGKNAFDGCTALTAVYVPKSVTKIGDGMIHNCWKFHDFNYAGSEADWDKVEKGDIHAYDDETVNNDMLFFNTPYEQVSGDANIDGKLNVADAVAVLQFIANQNKYELTAQGSRNADVDGEAGITGNDALMIQKIDAGIV